MTFTKCQKRRRLFIEKDIEYYESLPPPEISVRAKKRLNRMFREVVGSSNIPHPDVDNCYERIRSNIIFKIKLRVSKYKKTARK